MLARMNEYFIHQTQKPVGELASEAPDWDHALYFFFSDAAGAVGVFCGFEVFPNRRLQRATLFLRHGTEQYRTAAVQRWEDEPGPVLQAEGFRFACVDPMKHWRLDLRDAGNDITIGVDFAARCPAYAFKHTLLPGQYATAIDQRHYTQSGRLHGSLRVGGREYHDFVGMKNRSWGVRSWHHLPMYHWTTAQFSDFSINTWHFEDQDGTPLYMDGALTTEHGKVTPIVEVAHELELHPGSTKRVKARQVRLTTANGDVLQLEGQEIGSIPLAALPAHWSETDPQAMAQAETAALWFEQHTRFRLGAQRGIGFVEHCVAPGCAKHGIPPTPFPYLDPASSGEHH
jgi:hypothetical protein